MPNETMYVFAFGFFFFFLFFEYFKSCAVGLKEHFADLTVQQSCGAACENSWNSMSPDDVIIKWKTVNSFWSLMRKNKSEHHSL